jgi:hypothetical protein
LRPVLNLLIPEERPSGADTPDGQPNASPE